MATLCSDHSASEATNDKQLSFVLRFSHILLQNFRDLNTPVFILVIFHNGYDRSTHSQSRTVQSIYQFVLFPIFKTDLCTSWLEIIL